MTDLKPKKRSSDSNENFKPKKFKGEAKDAKNEKNTNKSNKKFDKSSKKPVTNGKPAGDKAAGFKKPFTKTFSKSGDKKQFGKKPFNNKSVKGGADAGNQEPPNWSEYKKKKKELRKTRRLAKLTEPDMQNILTKVKILSEKLRRKKGTPEEREKITKELHEILRAGNLYKQLVLAHDTSRIIQWLLKFGSVEMREEASKQLLGMTVELLQSKYARNCVKRMLKYGTPATRSDILRSLNGNVVKLAAHALSAPTLDYAYTTIANKKQKQHLHQEFYGDIYKATKDNSVECLRDTYKKSPEMKGAMLGATKANLLRVLNKNVHDCALVHAVLFEFLKECSNEDRAEFITTLSSHVAPLSNSKLGVKAAAMCVWHGSNKDKKTILKVVKEHVVPLSTHEHGHLLILAILSSVDDTVLVNKVLVATLLKEITTIAKEEWGRKVLLWLIAPGDKLHFHPTLTDWLSSSAAQGSSKKPAEVRATELLEAVMPALCRSVQEETELWLSSGSVCLVTVAILKSAPAALAESTYDKVCQFICNPEWKLTEEDKEVLGIEHAGIHLCLKKLAQNDKVRSAEDKYTLGDALCKQLNDDAITSWITTNRGCFFLLTVFENNSTQVQGSLKKLLLPWGKKLNQQNTAGAKILLKKIT